MALPVMDGPAAMVCMHCLHEAFTAAVDSGAPDPVMGSTDCSGAASARSPPLSLVTDTVAAPGGGRLGRRPSCRRDRTAEVVGFVHADFGVGAQPIEVSWTRRMSFDGAEFLVDVLQSFG